MSTICGLLFDENNVPSLSGNEAIKRDQLLPRQENKNVDTVEGNKKSTAPLVSPLSTTKAVVVAVVAKTATATESSIILAPFVASVLRDHVLTELLNEVSELKNEVHQLRTKNSKLQIFRDTVVDIVEEELAAANDDDDDDDDDDDKDNFDHFLFKNK